MSYTPSWKGCAHPRAFLFLLIVVLFLLFTIPARGQVVMTEKGKEFEPKVLHVPYAFYNQSFGAAGGFVCGLTGVGQKQMSILGTVIAGTNDALALYIVTRDVQVPWATAGMRW